MENLIILAILWAIFRAVANKARGRMPGPVPEEEHASYRLPPDLRGKWGPKENEEEASPQSEPANDMARPPYEATPGEAEIPNRVPVPKVEAPAAPQVSSVQNNAPSETGKEKNPCGKEIASRECFNYRDINPVMLRQGIILSEILAPPISRRKRDRYQ